MYSLGNRGREDRSFGSHVIRQQKSQLRRSIRGLKWEGFSHVFIFDTPEEVETAVIERTPLWNDKRDDHAPFDIVGDLHGCCDELETLLQNLGYQSVQRESEDPAWGNRSYRHPEGRKAVFLGDMADRGPRILDTLRLVRNMVADGCARAFPAITTRSCCGNSPGRMSRSRMVSLSESLAEIEALPEEVRQNFVREAADLVPRTRQPLRSRRGQVGGRSRRHEGGNAGRGSGKVREFALYGETTGETDEFGLPVRCNWAAEYRGRAMVVYGHTPVPQPEWLNRTINIDTGCVFGGKLTALRWPSGSSSRLPLVTPTRGPSFRLAAVAETARPHQSAGSRRFARRCR